LYVFKENNGLTNVKVLTRAGFELDFWLDIEPATAEEEERHQAERTDEQQQPR
jgi:hypothetical protein